MMSSEATTLTIRKCMVAFALCLACCLPRVVLARASETPSVSAANPAPNPVAGVKSTTAQMRSGRGDHLAVTLCVADCKPKKDDDSKCVTAKYDFFGRLAWPVTTILIVLILLLNKKRLSPLLKLLRRVKAGDVEFEFNTADALRAKASITEAYQEFKKTAQDAYSHFARVHQIQEHFDRALDAIRRQVEASVVEGKALTWPRDARATLHVPDIVIKEFTYQLLDYVPRGGGSGRRFSSRRGILGRAWRLERSFGTGNALEPSPTVGAKPDDTEETRLVQEWGMTRKEAGSWQQEPRKAFLCTIVREPEVGGVRGLAQGVVYIDSLTSNAFGDDTTAKGIASWAETDPAVVQLGKALGEAARDLREGGTFLEF